MSDKAKKKVVQGFLVFLFFLGLFLLFGIAGTMNYVDEAGIYLSLGYFITRGLLGIFLMFPLMLYFSFGGRLDGDDEKVR